MSELVSSEMVEENQNVNNAKKNKKLILWGILLVLVLIILYVLFGDDSKKYRLMTETRNALFVPNVDANPTSLSPTSSASVGGTMTSLSSTSSYIPTLSTSASGVRKQLANLFRSYS